MSKSQPQANKRFVWVATATIAVTALIIVAILPVAVSYAQDRAVTVATAAAEGRIDLETGYKIAIKLDPKNQDYPVVLATHYLDARRAEDAQSVLSHHDGLEIAITSSRAKIELGRGEGEIVSPSSESSALQQASWLAVNGKTNEVMNLKPLVLTEAGERSLLKISSGGTALAAELLANHMPQAALRTLETAPERSVSRFTALGALLLATADNKREQLDKAAQAASEALSIDPSSIEAHELKRRVLITRGEREEANQEAQIIEALRAGRF